MKNFYFVLITFVLIASSFIDTSFKEKNKTRVVINIDKNWKFYEGQLSNAYLPKFNDVNWEKVDVPNDWRIHNRYGKDNERRSGYLPKGIGWYRKIIDIKPEYIDKSVYISFDGVFRNYTVWVNGKKAGWHLSGYTGCVLDITKLIDFHSTNNLLTVLVDNIDSNRLVMPHPQSEYAPGKEGWWYEGYGIYRHVNLIITDQIHVSTWGTFVYTKNESQESAGVYMKVKVTNQTAYPHRLLVKNLIFDPQGKQVEEASEQYAIKAKDEIDICQAGKVVNPKLWSPEHPNLYNVVTQVFSDGVLKDEYKTPIGIRWFKFTSDGGFFLNGRHMQLRGMNIHAGFGGLGTALPDRANDYDVELAKKMGCNIIRSAHNDPSPSLMEACDKLGMLLWSETRYLGKDTFALATLRDMIQRDRNHPSIICWGLANNSGRNDTALTNMLEAMNVVARQEDPTRPTIFGSEANGDPNKTGFAFVTDLMGYNGGGMGRDDRDHKNYPNRKMLISEYSSGRGTRGNYEKKLVGEDESETWGDGRKVSGGYLYSIYDLCKAHEKEWSHIATRPWLAGGIMWSGIEYLGETSGWPVVTSQFGVLDVARFKKDAYYYYLQEWTKKPLVHIFPNWTWNKKDSVINVWCYSNCDKVELVLNGKSLGVKNKVPLSHIEWKVPYQSGTLLARGYNANGKIIAVDLLKTAATATKIIAVADKNSIKADGNDLSFITIKVCDKNGTMIPDADNLIEINVKGGKLIGLCNGNPISHVDPSSKEMNVFNGMLLAIVQSEDHSKGIKVDVRSLGLRSGIVEITTK